MSRLDVKLFKRRQILESSKAVRSSIIKTVEMVPPSMQEVIFLGKWTIKELITHLIGWDKTNLLAAKSILQGDLPEFYSYIDRDWRQYNAILIARFWMDDWNQLLQSVKDSHTELIQFLGDMPVEDFFKDQGVRYKGYKVTIPRLVEAELSDEKAHLVQVSRWMDSSLGREMGKG